jgi:hypothetical protein
LESLRVPSTLSRANRDAVSAEPNLVARLVLDSVLEIEHDGHFLSGAQAAEVLQLAPVNEFTDTRAPAQVSRDALRYAEALGLSDPPALSMRLYFYNRVPISPCWTHRIGTPEGLTSWVGIEAVAPLRAQFTRGWEEVPPPPDNPGWRHFRHSGHVRGGRFKLYINPRADFLREAIEATLPTLSENGFGAFKVGRDLNGLLRPDKFVAYAASRKQIDSVAQALLSKLRGMPAQAVPFTAGIDDDGLLSWGVDPPRSELLSSWQGTSWRRWITDTLAVALVAARAGGARELLRFALQRITLDGVDVNSWTPDGIAWAREESP